ncbi:MAG: EAL domain-containing protein [Betaproteobacteria bacterium]|nr:EAL domain-containing protein [Betaproteobacteria bacterium]
MPLRRLSRRRLIVIVWLFTALVLGLLAVFWQATALLSAGRAYVAGESMWSKAQKDAVYHLARYARYRETADWSGYESALAVIEGDRRARTELEKAQPDLFIARQGFIQGGNHPADVDRMIWLFRTFRNNARISHAIDIWTQADAHADELAAVARKVRAGVVRGELSGADVNAALREINRLNGVMTRQEREFSATLGEAQRETQQALLVGMFAVAGVLLALSIWISLRIVKRHEAREQALSMSESRLRTLLQSAPLPLMITQPRQQRILYANDRARQVLNLPEILPALFPIPRHYEDQQQRDHMLEILDRDGVLKDYEVRLRDAKGNPFWSLVSAQKVSWAGEDCTFVAFNDIDERKRLQDDMRFRAFHDELTDLPNRTMFMESLQRALGKARRHGTHVSLLFIDMDRFKDINDTLGHTVGDDLLRAVATRLVESVRDSDLVARLGGDEFVVLVDDHDSPADVAMVAENLLLALARPYPLDGHHLSLTASIGISTWPTNGPDAATLVKNADIAMYQAKEQGRNNYQFYAAALDTLSVQRLDFESRLRNALTNNELVLHYQPVVNLESGRVAAFEALLRWQDPELGLTLPGKFMPFAEETGVIVPIGHWALGRACLDLASWREEPGLGALRISVNLSARQFLNDSLLRDVEEALAAARIPASALELEVTETSMIKDHARANRLLQALKRHGTAVAIDDFGIGHSSLSQMKRLPADSLKIDKTFVDDCANDPNSAAIIRAIIVMAHNLGLTVIAEGVEDKEQLALLVTLGCDFAQGWYFSHAMPAEDAAQFARESRWNLKALVDQPRLRAVPAGGAGDMLSRERSA